jgi:hypothetical protein
MNKIQILTLKSFRRLYQFIFGLETNIKSDCIQDAEVASQIMFDALTSDKPCMIARFGSTELTCLMNYVGVTDDENNYLSYFQGKSQSWWWNQNILDQMQNFSGFFPPTQEKIEQFCQLMLSDIPQLDILGSWLVHESEFDHLMENCRKINFELLNPYFSKIPWTKALEGKKVLVVHPFARTIEIQFEDMKVVGKITNINYTDQKFLCLAEIAF